MQVAPLTLAGPRAGALDRTALHCTALHRAVLHRTALHCTALHCDTAQVYLEWPAASGPRSGGLCSTSCWRPGRPASPWCRRLAGVTTPEWWSCCPWWPRRTSPWGSARFGWAPTMQGEIPAALLHYGTTALLHYRTTALPHRCSPSTASTWGAMTGLTPSRPAVLRQCSEHCRTGPWYWVAPCRGPYGPGWCWGHLAGSHFILDSSSPVCRQGESIAISSGFSIITQSPFLSGFRGLAVLGALPKWPIAPCAAPCRGPWHPGLLS